MLLIFSISEYRSPSYLTSTLQAGQPELGVAQEQVEKMQHPKENHLLLTSKFTIFWYAPQPS